MTPSTGWSRIARRIRVPAGFAFAILYLWLARPTWKSLMCGSAFVALGLLLRAFASGHVKKNEQLITSGPYAYTRNPLYLGSLILALGFAIAALSWWIAVATGMIFIVIYLPVIKAEESFLREHFAEFEEYSRNIPLLFPRVTRMRRNKSQFSWQLYLKHREYRAALGSSVLIAVLIGKMVWRT